MSRLASTEDDALRESCDWGTGASNDSQRVWSWTYAVGSDALGLLGATVAKVIPS